MNCFKHQDQLYVILPYFNFCDFKRRQQLFIDFIERLKYTPGIRIVISEAFLNSRTRLPNLPVFGHFVFKTEDKLWLKENLVNLAVEKLPKNWKYMAWIDADIEFLNQNWVSETIDELQTSDIVQLFQTCVNLGPKNEAIKIDKSFCYMFKDSGTQLSASDKYGFWHTGYAWACRRKAWDTMGGLIDWAILGSGDRHMALAWIGKADTSYPSGIHQKYKNMVLDFEKACKDFRVSYVWGTILHFWHGQFKDRRYKERWTILTPEKYDPTVDVGVNEDGLIQFSKKGQRLQKEFADYFKNRKEDST